MITITHPKVGGFKPVWAPFKGFSLLFDNPGDNFSPFDTSLPLEKVDCKYAVAETAFYNVIWDLAKTYEQLTRSYLFCPLPIHSYHVTVWDGLNAANVNKVCWAQREQVDQVLNRLPNSLADEHPCYETGEGARIQIPLEKKITFAFDRCENWGNTGVVARIKPADPDSEGVLRQIEEQRNRLIRDFKERFGLLTTTEAYRPHVSIGYFANKEEASLSSAAIEALNETLGKKLAGITLTFSSISLYGMTNMETFFRRAVGTP